MAHGHPSQIQGIGVYRALETHSSLSPPTVEKLNILRGTKLDSGRMGLSWGLS